MRKKQGVNKTQDWRWDFFHLALVPFVLLFTLVNYEPAWHKNFLLRHFQSVQQNTWVLQLLLRNHEYIFTFDDACLETHTSSEFVLIMVDMPNELSSYNS